MESERLDKNAHKYEHNDGKSIKYHEKMIAASYVAEGLTKNRELDHIYKGINPGDKKRTTGTFYDLKIWDEENSVFHWLKTHWNFDHIFSSDPHVIQAMYYIYLIAYNLFHLYRNLRTFDFKKDIFKKILQGNYLLK